MLLTGAGLLIYSFAKALRVDTGIEPSKVVTARIALTREHRASPTPPTRSANAVPGDAGDSGRHVRRAVFSTPFQGGRPINAFTLENDTLPPGAPQPGAFRVIVTPGYPETMGLKVVEGRFDQEADLLAGPCSSSIRVSRGSSSPMALLSVENSPLAAGGKPEEGPSIIGVVKDVPHNGVSRRAGTLSSINSFRADDRED